MRMGTAHLTHAGRTWRACAVGAVCGALALTGTAHAKMACPMGDADQGGNPAAAGPDGSDRSGSAAPLAPATGSQPAGSAAGPGSSGRPAASQPAESTAGSVPAEVPATTSVPATTGTSVPTATSVPAATTVPVAVPAYTTAVDVRAQAAAERRAARRAAERRAERRAAARRAAERRAATKALRARVAGSEREFTPWTGSAWVEPAAPKAAVTSDGSPELPLVLGLLSLLGLGGLVAAVVRRRRGDEGMPAVTVVTPLDPAAAAHAARVEAELQEIIAEERAARELDGSTAGGPR